ncbi:hypothetical protein RclHR1_09310005 [Rhizophagus clarus]|uniref:DUF659 domain-containing protein n=1 Tax=Rhizophagus clarus TaxID=94130 RepID=A0A2Z6SHC3_9GLOM|nr:hypothetical protein RclHR1_09310005 [Rhizophagus clarus]
MEVLLLFLCLWNVISIETGLWTLDFGRELTSLDSWISNETPSPWPGTDLNSLDNLDFEQDTFLDLDCERIWISAWVMKGKGTLSWIWISAWIMKGTIFLDLNFGLGYVDNSIENDQNNQNITQKKEVVHKNEVGCGSDHLSGKHQIIKETIKQNYVPLESYGLEIPPHKESRQIELCNLLVSWIISDTQPLNITQSKFFQKFIKELDLAFDIPNVKLIKQTIHSTYNHTLPLIQKFVEKNAISVSLTTDMWTGRNRQGFLGVTCSFLDKNFKIHEVIL